MVVHRDLTNSIEDWRLLDDYEAALRDLLHFYDRARGAVGHGEGWTAADILRLGQIRAMVYPDVVDRESRWPFQRTGSPQRAKCSGYAPEA